jgi:hypothetical protein
MKTKEKYRGPIFTQFKKVLKLFIKKPNTIFLGNLPSQNTVILSNHVGTSAPLKLELYYPHQIRFWGAHQMNSGLVSLYKYQSYVFYHKKKGWSLLGARLFCLLAAPLTYMFYKGLNLISTYQDTRFRTTLKQSMEVLNNQQNIVIFPEDSKYGYQDELIGFHPGFVLLLETAIKQNKDLNVVVAYLNKKENVFIFDKPILASTLFEKYTSKEQIAQALNNRCNQLGRMTKQQEPQLQEQNQSI